MIWVRLAASIAALSVAFWAGWSVQDWRRYARELNAREDAAELQRLQARGADRAAVAHEDFKERERVVYQTITQTVDRIVDRPVYRNVCLDDDGVRAINAAVRGSDGNPGEPAAAVPESR